MTSKDNIIYYTITAVVFVGIVVCSLLLHNAEQPTNGGSERENISTIVIAVSPFLTAAATIVLVGITWWYAKTTDKILRAANKPEVVVYLYPDEKRLSDIYLYIENIGTGVASDVRFKGDFSFAPPTETPLEPLSKLTMLKYGIDYLIPEKKFRTFLFMTGSVPHIAGQSLDITVEYKDSIGTEYEKNFVLEFSKWENFEEHFVEREPINEIADTLKRAERELCFYLAQRWDEEKTRESSTTEESEN